MVYVSLAPIFDTCLTSLLEYAYTVDNLTTRTSRNPHSRFASVASKNLKLNAQRSAFVNYVRDIDSMQRMHNGWENECNHPMSVLGCSFVVRAHKCPPVSVTIGTISSLVIGVTFVSDCEEIMITVINERA